MKQKIILLIFATLIVSCGSFNEGHAELHINKNISTIDIEDMDGGSENVKVRINIDGDNIEFNTEEE